MKAKRNIIITIFCLIAICFVLIGVSNVECTKTKETEHWLEQITKLVSTKDNKAYDVEKVLSIKRPLTDELDSISGTFFKENVNSTNIRIIEALIKKDNQEVYVDIVAEVNEASTIKKLNKVSGILVKNQTKKKLILVNVLIK